MKLTYCLYTALETIGNALLQAKKPLIITSYLGRNKDAVDALVKLSDSISIPIFLTCPTVVNVPWSCKTLVGMNYGMGKNEWLEDSDCVLILDSDVPWIPLHTRPKEGTKVFHIDVDPLKQNVNVFQ
jgi:thiamine pyrophosphate-dependent acetolactate synthase large subunit-like protein